MVRPTAAGLTVPLSRAKDTTVLASVLHVLGTKSRLDTLQLLMDDSSIRCMSNHPAEGAGRSESSLADDDFSPTWADDGRPRIPRVAPEREALAGYLEYYRATVEMKSRGLTSEQARIRAMPPSTLSMHGMVRHLAGVERWWFQQNFERRDVPFLFITTDNPNLDFDPPSDADFAADLEAWRAECAVSREIVVAHDLDATARPLDWYEDVDL